MLNLLTPLPPTRILDMDSDKQVSNLLLYLLPSEAKELLDSLASVLANPAHANHAHVPSLDFSGEIRVCVYDPSRLAGFDDRSKAIILGEP